MKMISILLIAGAFLVSCAVSVSHPKKGKSIFNSHQETKDMSPELREDLGDCRKFSEDMLIKSGLKIYRVPHSAIKQCLRNKGWEFNP
jgi:hypothetical protein